MSGLDRKTLLPDLLFDLVGCFAFSIAIQSFSAPNNIAPGGVSGIAILLHYLFGLPISVLSFVLNIPLLLLAWRFLGRGFTVRTVKTVAILSILLGLCEALPTYEGNLILAALYCGVLEGFGLAAVLARGSTTGGSDIASRLIQLKYPHISVGKLLLVVDGMVLAASAIVYQNIESALYGLIVIFTAGRVIDSTLYGLDAGKVMMVVSERFREISEEISGRLGRGCTILEGRSGYTGSQRDVLFCAVRKPQFIILKRIVRAIDPNAFLVALEANEIIGEGFKPIDE